MRVTFSSQLDQLLVRLHTSAPVLMSELLLILVIAQMIDSASLLSAMSLTNDFSTLIRSNGTSASIKVRNTRYQNLPGKLQHPLWSVPGGFTTCAVGLFNRFRPIAATDLQHSLHFNFCVAIIMPSCRSAPD